MTATVLFPRCAEGPMLVLTAPLGEIIGTRHPQRGHGVSGTILVVPEPIGSSSSSAVGRLVRDEAAWQ